MDDELQVERDILLEQPTNEVWSLVGTAEGWQQWLVDTAAVEVRDGAVGEIVDDGVRRSVRVTRVDADRAVTFQWWERGRPDDASEVSIRLHELPGGGSRVHIVERSPAASARAGATAGAAPLSVWEVRACLLALSLHTAMPALVRA